MTITAYVNDAFDQCVVDPLEPSVKPTGLSTNEISIAWHNLRYEVGQLSGWSWTKKPILRQLNGFVRRGTLNGLMGPSGAGKTTLIDVLCGNLRKGLCAASQIYLNRDPQQSSISYFIAQHVHESIVQEMTVSHILRYAFIFKNGWGHRSAMHRHITHVLADLMLPLDLLDRPFGKCSGGEQKRIAIGQELMSLSAPSFLFVDEPTTGLDSGAAFQVVQCLKKLVFKHQMTVIASIHSPNNEVLSLFDKLYVLARGGVCIYSGEPQLIESHLRLHIQMNVPSGQPPVEALMKLACNGINDENVVKLANKTFTTEQSYLMPHLTNLSLQRQGIPSPRKLFSICDFFLELYRLCHISFVSKWRSFAFIGFLFVAYFCVLSTMFNSSIAEARGCYDIEESVSLNCTNFNHLEDNFDVKQNGNFLMFATLMVGFIIMCTSSLFYSANAKVFKSEHRNYWYSLGSFFWSSVIVSFLEANFYAFLITILSYFLSGQHGADLYAIHWERLGTYGLFIWLLCLYCQAFGQLIGIIMINYVQISIVFCEIIYLASCLFNGLYIKMERTGSDALVTLSDWIGLIYITRGIFYAFYGIDRCDVEKEFSWVLVDHSVDGDKLAFYATKVLLNVAIFRVLTLIMMYVKFNTFGNALSGKRVHRQIENGIKEFAQLNCDNVAHAKSDDFNNNWIEVTKEEKELMFNTFSRNKIIIAWRHLTLYGSSSIFDTGSKKVNSKAQIILKNLNGQFQFGTLNALMGTSGAGKTSLLKVLNGRCKTRLDSQSEFYLSKFTKITTCFITQEVSGHLMPGLTAKQSLIYASKLKNSGFPDIDHEGVAIKLLTELDLITTVNTRVERCSGGERKRLALSLELTSRQMPNLICIDEPTSGLDSNSSEIVISCLRKLAHAHNLTIIASIHQPNIEILTMFDQLYILARGGVAVYSGPPNQIQDRLDSISQSPSSEHKFAIEVIIKHSCLGPQSEVVQKLAQLDDKQYLSKEKDVQLNEQTQLVPDGIVPNRTRISANSVLNLSLRFLAYTRGYLWKEWIFIVLNFTGYGYMLTAFYDRKMIFISGCLNPEDDFNNTCSKTAAQLEEDFLLADNILYDWFASNAYLLLMVIGSSLNFHREFVFFENEHWNGWYSSGSFYLMKSLLEILSLTPIIMVYVFLIHIYDPVIPGGIYWPLLLIFLLSTIGILGMAHCISLLGKDDLMVQTIIMVCSFLLTMLVGNFYIPIRKMHYFYQFLSHTSISRYMLEAMFLLQYGFDRCGPKEIQPILYTMSLEDEDYYRCIWMLVFNFVFYRVVAVGLLLWRANTAENRIKTKSDLDKIDSKLRLEIGVMPGIGSSSQRFTIHQTHV